MTSSIEASAFDVTIATDLMQMNEKLKKNYVPSQSASVLAIALVIDLRFKMVW
jgi:hypothetical protein